MWGWLSQTGPYTQGHTEALSETVVCTQACHTQMHGSRSSDTLGCRPQHTCRHSDTWGRVRHVCQPFCSRLGDVINQRHNVGNSTGEMTPFL